MQSAICDSICQIHGVDDGIESDGGDDDCVDGDDDNNANILYLRLLVVGGQWSLIADTQVMSSHSYLDSLLLHSQMKVMQVQNYNISDVFSFLIVQIINTELPNTKWTAFSCWIHNNAQSFMCSTKLRSTLNWGNKKLC